MKKNDGGPALMGWAFKPDGGFEVTSQMTLRDYFAAQALAGNLASADFDPSPDDGETYDECVARICYEYADAMLKARED